jgi:hypothetical protein
MVLREPRTQLHEALAALINGELLSDDFTDAYCRLWHDSDDRAVAEIAQFGWGLYSDDWPRYFRGRYAIGAESRQFAQRCLLFLQTDLEYEWPQWPRRSAGQWLALPAAVVAGAVMSVLLIVGGAMLAAGEWWPAGAVARVVLVLLALMVWAIRYFYSQETPAWREFWAAGDRDCWPFLHQADLERAAVRGRPPEPAASVRRLL